MTYDLCITAVSERADLFAVALASILAHVDVQPARIVVHEDVRPGSRSGAIGDWLAAHSPVPFAHAVTVPALGLGRAMEWCFSRTSGIALYTQEDHAAVRPLPIRAALDVMQRHDLNHICFQWRPIRASKSHRGQPGSDWPTVERRFGDVTLSISDHWYTQTGLWRVAPALDGMRAVLAGQTIDSSNQFAVAFNRHMNDRHGDGRAWNDHDMRADVMRTFAWGGIGEPAFVRNLDTDATRTTGPERPRFRCA